MRRITRAVNNYFFDADEITASDAALFYGVMGAALFAAVVVWLF